jgi:hypothetical protein
MPYRPDLSGAARAPDREDVNAESVPLVETTSTARELYDRVLALYPDHINPDTLWRSAQGVTPRVIAS